MLAAYAGLTYYSTPRYTLAIFNLVLEESPSSGGAVGCVHTPQPPLTTEIPRDPVVFHWLQGYNIR